MKMNRYIELGVPILYDGPEFERICPNWDSTKKFRSEVSKSIKEDLALGRKSGPFLSPPCRNFIASPLGAFEKKHSNKIRIIHDLSWPPDESVNSFIPAHMCTVSYISVDDAVKQVKLRGKHSLMSKLDLKDAYKCVTVRPEDRHYLGSSWVDDDGHVKFYLDNVLPFGLRSSATLFNLFASGLEFGMLNVGATNARHYLDDFFTCGGPKSNECQQNLDIMLAVSAELGMPVNPSKTVLPTTTLEFLGIIIDTDAMELRMSDIRLAEVMDELNYWHDRKIGSKRRLLSLLGKLVFICRVIQPGRIFLRRLFDASTKVRLLFHRVRLTSEAMKDISWWRTFLLIWNGKSLFLDDLWMSNSVLNLASDVSNAGMGAVFNNAWWFAPFDQTHLAFPIAWRELYAVLVACRVWGHALSSRRLMIACDNIAIVFSVNKGTSKNPNIMSLIRDLFFTCSFFHFDIRMKHVPGLLNVGPDLLSRLKVPQFKRTFPEADRSPIAIPPLYLSY
jgi:hypothetical protein